MEVNELLLPNYNPVMIRRINSKPALRPFKGVGQMRERGSDSGWFPVEFLVYYDDHNKIRTFAYVRRADGSDIPDGEYDVVDELGEHGRRWRKWKGEWRVKWRHRWGRKS
jgi:hypothetical protein